MAMHDYDTLEGLLSNYDQSRIRLADENTVKDLKQLMSSYDPQVYDFGKFEDSYTKTIDDFLNPEADKIAKLKDEPTDDMYAGGHGIEVGGLT